MAPDLAPVYLDDARVTLQGDPRPQVAKILQASGQRAQEGVLVVRLREAFGADGQPVGLTDVIDRETATTPVYLRVVKGEEPARASHGHSPGAGGGIRTQETASEEGSRPPRDPRRGSITTTSRDSLENASEEE